MNSGTRRRTQSFSYSRVLKIGLDRGLVNTLNLDCAHREKERRKSLHDERSPMNDVNESEQDLEDLRKELDEQQRITRVSSNVFDSEEYICGGIVFPTFKQREEGVSQSGDPQYDLFCSHTQYFLDRVHYMLEGDLNRAEIDYHLFERSGTPEITLQLYRLVIAVISICEKQIYTKSFETIYEIFTWLWNLQHIMSLVFFTSFLDSMMAKISGRHYFAELHEEAQNQDTPIEFKHWFYDFFNIVLDVMNHSTKRRQKAECAKFILFLAEHGSIVERPDRHIIISDAARLLLAQGNADMAAKLYDCAICNVDEIEDPQERVFYLWFYLNSLVQAGRYHNTPPIIEELENLQKFISQSTPPMVHDLYMLKIQCMLKLHKFEEAYNTSLDALEERRSTGKMFGYRKQIAPVHNIGIHEAASQTVTSPDKVFHLNIQSAEAMMWNQRQ